MPSTPGRATRKGVSPGTTAPGATGGSAPTPAGPIGGAVEDLHELAGVPVGAARVVLSGRRRKMTAARSRGKATSTCAAVRVPARKADTNAGSRVGATAVIPAILEIQRERGRPIQKAEALRSILPT